MPGADKQQRWPGAFDGIFIEKFDTAQGDSAGTAAPFFNIFTIQKIISQIVFSNFVGEFVAVVRYHLHPAVQSISFSKRCRISKTREQKAIIFSE